MAGLLVARDWWPMLRKNQSFMVIMSIAIEFVPAIRWDCRGLWGVAMIRLRSHIGWAVPRECSTRTGACAIPNMFGIVNTQSRRCESRGISGFRGEWIDCNSDNQSKCLSMICGKTLFSQPDEERRPIRSIASDCITRIYDTVALNVMQNSANK